MSSLRQHAEWLSLIEVSGPFVTMPVLLDIFPQGLEKEDDEPELRRMLRLAYAEWADNQVGARPEQAIHYEWLRFVLASVLDMPRNLLLEGQALPASLRVYVAEHGETLQPEITLVSPETCTSRLLISLYPNGQYLEKPVAGRRWTASPATRMMELLRRTGTRLGLVTNGRYWMLVDAPPNETTGFATWDAELWTDEFLTLRAFRNLLGVRRFFGVPDEETLEKMLEESAKNQQEVTDRLGYQVREAVELLVSSLDTIDKEQQRRLLVDVSEGELYESALTVMMRLVFLLSAEERGLLRLGELLYDRYYAVSTLQATLREQADQFGEEVLERRHDAWVRLLAIFRVIYGGVEHQDLRLPAYGGHLFDPDRFPFLEGRPAKTSWQATPAQPIAINNRTVLHLLEALQFLQIHVVRGEPAERRRLSFRALDTALRLRRQIITIPDDNVEHIEQKEHLLAEAEEAMALVKLGADLLIAGTLYSLSKPSESNGTTIDLPTVADYATVVSTYQDARRDNFTEEGRTEGRAEFQHMRKRVDKLLNQRRPFHWPLEFPEVFATGLDDQGGFSAIISNPPFQGGQKITGILGTDYRDYLVEYLAHGKRGSADLCTYFFLQASQLVCLDGQCGLLATNTIAQGDTRDVGLDQIIASGWTIPRAISSRKWPGEANLEVAQLWLRHGDWHGPYTLNDLPVIGITSFLTSLSTVEGKPYQLVANAGKSFIGSYVMGTGFVLEPEQALALIKLDARNKDILFPYLNGEDLNSRPDQSPSRWVINFHNWSLQQAETYPECIRIVQEKVKPEREKQNDKIGKEFWWLYLRSRPALHSAIANMRRVLLIPFVSKYMISSWEPTGIIYAHPLIIIATQSDADFALIQCTFHSDWARANGSSLRNDQRYTPTDCFETFPFPHYIQTLDDIGEHYYQHRQSIMTARQEGLTKTYNRFHNEQEMAEDIVQLRVLHREMDEAVAHAYGWDDLELEHGFHVTKQGMRYTISKAARTEVLDRLLQLNHERYAEEVALGLHEKGAKSGKGKKSGGKAKWCIR